MTQLASSLVGVLTHRATVSVEDWGKADKEVSVPHWHLSPAQRTAGQDVVAISCPVVKIYFHLVRRR